MTQYRNTFEGGTNGVAVSGSNMGGSSGDQPTGLLFDGSSTGVFDTTRAAHGSMSMHVTPTASPGHSYLQYLGLNSTGTASRMYLYMTALPTADMILLRHVAGSATIGYVKFISTGALRIIDSAGNTVWTSTTTFPLNAWTRLDFFTDTSNNKIRTAWGALDAAASVDSTLLTMVGGGAAATRSDLGKVTGAYATDLWIDDVAVDDAATGFITPGAPVGALAATMTLVPNTGTIPFSVTSTVTATGGTGTVKNFSWAWGDGGTTAAQTSNIATHSYTTAGTWTVTATVVNT